MPFSCIVHVNTFQYAFSFPRLTLPNHEGKLVCSYYLYIIFLCIDCLGLSCIFLIFYNADDFALCVRGQRLQQLLSFSLYLLID